jgi:hypothetical protein
LAGIVVTASKGRFLSQPVERKNLHRDLTDFLTEVIGGAERNPSAGERRAYDDLAKSLIVNVLDHHLDATYWQGRAAGYRDHHGTEAVSDPSDVLTKNRTETTGARS